MSKYVEVRKKPALWFIFISIILVIIFGSVVITEAREQNWLILAIQAAVDAFPFGVLLLQIEAAILDSLTGLAQLHLNNPSSFNIFHELIKLLFCGVLLDLFKELCKILLGADEKGTRKEKTKYFFSTLLAVFLCTLAAEIIVAAIESTLGAGWSLALEIIICLVTVVAGIFIAIGKYSLKSGFLYAGVKYLLLNTLLVEFYGIMVMIILDSIQRGAFEWLKLGIPTILLLLIVLVGISVMVDSVFPSPKYEIRTR